MKKLSYLLFSIPLLWGLNACTEDFEPTFSENATQRYINVQKEITEFLSTPDADFILQYFPDDHQSYGGYNYFLKFSGKDKVSAESETNAQAVSSTFRILQNGGAVLSFDLYSEELHEFATPSPSEYRAKRGDFEFLILKKSNDTLYLKGKKTGNYMKLYKAGNIQEIKSNIRKVATTIDRVDLPAQGTIGTEPLVLSTGGTRNIIFSTLNGGSLESTEASYIFTENGIKFYKPVEIKGKVYDGLIFDESTQTLKSEDGVIVINLKFVPINFKSKAWFLDMSKSENTSEGYKKARAGDSLWHGRVLSKFKLQDFYVLGNFRDNVGFNTFVEGYNGAFAIYGLSFKGEDSNPNLIHIEKTKPVEFDVYFKYVDSVLDKITKNSPYIVEEVRATPKRVKLTSQKDSKLWFYLDEL
ncbi:DUF4302 domain-containing protein [Ornithobacterium rhinotracheale]|uniref:DUF4302 domain-containing protein n=1 Tax=Ornithobacterium rhinotracheale TaxID=28251 RepID=UPI003FA47BEB